MYLFNDHKWMVLDTVQSEHSIRLTVEYWEKPNQCLKCAAMHPELVRYGNRPATYVDLPHAGKRIIMVVRQQRYRCGECKKVFQQRIPELHESHRLTQRAVTYIRECTLARTHSEIARELGVDVKTIYNVFIEWAKEMDANHKAIAPSVLGIDEIFALGRARCVLTNIRENTVVDMLEDRNKDTVQNWLQRLQDRYRVEVVAMDMWQPYLDAVQPFFPKVPVIIDKFHVVRMANLCLDTYRKTLKASLTHAEVRRLKKDRFLLLRRYAELTPSDRIIFESWINRFPLLKEAHRLKEDFYAVYSHASRGEAEKAYEEWQKSIPGGLSNHFHILTRAVKNWHTQVFNYFDVQPRVTNAFTESLNNLIAHIINDGRGYSFPVLRAKVLFSKRKELPLVRRSFDGLDAEAAADGHRGDLGADISTLLREYGLTSL